MELLTARPLRPFIPWPVVTFILLVMAAQRAFAPQGPTYELLLHTDDDGGKATQTVEVRDKCRLCIKEKEWKCNPPEQRNNDDHKLKRAFQIVQTADPNLAMLKVTTSKKASGIGIYLCEGFVVVKQSFRDTAVIRDDGDHSATVQLGKMKGAIVSCILLALPANSIFGLYQRKLFGSDEPSDSRDLGQLNLPPGVTDATPIRYNVQQTDGNKWQVVVESGTPQNASTGLALFAFVRRGTLVWKLRRYRRKPPPHAIAVIVPGKGVKLNSGRFSWHDRPTFSTKDSDIVLKTRETVPMISEQIIGYDEQSSDDHS